jgi:hypothetical protein
MNDALLTPLPVAPPAAQPKLHRYRLRYVGHSALWQEIEFASNDPIWAAYQRLRERGHEVSESSYIFPGALLSLERIDEGEDMGDPA